MASAVSSSVVTGGVGHPARVASGVVATSVDTVRTSNSVSSGFSNIQCVFDINSEFSLSPLIGIQ